MKPRKVRIKLSIIYISIEINSLFIRLESITELNQRLNSNISVNYMDINNPFIQCEYNRIETSYRSPFTNEYYPPVNVAKYPLEELRKMEVEFGKLFSQYAKLYYSNKTTSSVYAWDMGDSIINGFGLCTLIYSETNNSIISTINVFNIKFSKEITKNKEYVKVSYKQTSTMNIELNFNNLSKDSYLSTSLSRSILDDNVYTDDYLNYEFHYEKLGKMIEQAENSLRLQIEHVQVNKIKDIISNIKQKPTDVDRNSIMKSIIDEQKTNKN
jgi:capping protein beta